MTTDAKAFPGELRWENDGISRIPFKTYTDEALYRKELERFFYRGHWNYIGLEVDRGIIERQSS